MAEPQTERRSSRRFSLDLPVAVKFLEDGTYEVTGEVTGRTRDVSSRGVFFYLNSQIREGASIEFVMTLPSEITLTDPIRIQCSGKVVRVDRSRLEQGVAVAIDKYDFVNET